MSEFVLRSFLNRAPQVVMEKRPLNKCECCYKYPSLTVNWCEKWKWNWENQCRKIYGDVHAVAGTGTVPTLVWRCVLYRVWSTWHCVETEMCRLCCDWHVVVNVLLLVYSEVENRIAAFRGMLYSKLMMMPSSPDEQKKLIRSVLCWDSDVA